MDYLVKYLLIALLLLSTGLSHAQQAPSLFLDIHGLSHHPVKEYIANTHTVYTSEGDVLSIEETTHSFNQLNRGLGLTYTLTPTTTLSVGFYHNSYWKNTKYITYNKQFYKYKQLRVGVSGGIATGYINISKLVLFPTISVGDGWRVNVGVVPEYGDKTTSAVFMSLSFKIL